MRKPTALKDQSTTSPFLKRDSEGSEGRSAPLGSVCDMNLSPETGPNNRDFL